MVQQKSTECQLRKFWLESRLPLSDTGGVSQTLGLPSVAPTSQGNKEECTSLRGTSHTPKHQAEGPAALGLQPGEATARATSTPPRTGVQEGTGPRQGEARTEQGHPVGHGETRVFL